MNKLLIFFTFLLLIVFPSCQVTENITLSDAGNTSEGEIIVSDFLDTVPDDPLHAGSILHEIEFIFPVLVERIGEFCLLAVHDMETVFL